MLQAEQSVAGRGIWSSIFRVDGLAMLLACVFTLAASIGTFWLVGYWGYSSRSALVFSLAASMLWIAVIVPSLAATSQSWMSSLLRCGTVPDTILVAMLILIPMTRDDQDVSYLSAGTILKIYCVVVAMAIFLIAVVRMLRSNTGRMCLAVLVSVLMLAAIASPFWIGAWFDSGDYDGNQRLAECAVTINPFCPAITVLADRIHFTWYTQQAMYEYTRLGEFVAPPPARWYMTCVVYLAMAAICLLIGFAIGRIAKKISGNAAISEASAVGSPPPA